MLRESIIRELAIQSLERDAHLEDHLQRELVAAAVREGVTLYEIVRERLLLKAGVATVGALYAASDRLMHFRQILAEGEATASRGATLAQRPTAA